MKYYLSVAWLCLALAGCAPKAVVHTTQFMQPLAVYEGFLVVKETEEFTDAAQELGEIAIKDNAGMSLICDYETVLELATKQARQMGANVLRIYEHRTPSLYSSSCHRIRAKALRVADITPYEKEVLWHPARRLRQADFKGSLEERPFQAATSSSLRYRVANNLLQGTVQYTIDTYFDCQQSYFKPSRDNAHTLAHEQLHFDITEVYARRFAKTLQEQIATTQDLENRHEELYRQLMLECQLLQDKYDSEVYDDRNKLPAWQRKIEQELVALQPYAAKQFTLKRKL